ncbi:MAG: hypothetical protein J6M34_05375 [Clostridia bacterium]|nr:hypothetical protein [Clostridia bacterium]
MKKILALLLVLVMTAALFAGCSGSEQSDGYKLTNQEKESEITYILTAKKNGETVEYGKAPYLYYLQWLRDYYYAYITSISSQLGSNAPTWDKMLESTLFTAPDTLSQAIVSTAQEQYMTYLFVEEKFNELGLKLSEDEIKTVDALIQSDWIALYGHDGFNTIRQTLGLSYDEFWNIVACNTKTEKLIEYYYGEGGPLEVTKEDKQEYFENYYARFKYVIFATQDSDGNKYGEKKLNEVYAKRDAALAELDNGVPFEEVLAKYSEDYKDLSDEKLTVSQKQAYEAQNKAMVEDGLVISDKGVFSETLATYYNITVEDGVVNKIFAMKDGDVQAITGSNAIWIVKRYDATEKEAYFNDVESLIFKALYAEDFETTIKDWKADLSYQFNLEALDVYAPANLHDLFDLIGTTKK